MQYLHPLLWKLKEFPFLSPRSYTGEYLSKICTKFHDLMAGLGQYLNQLYDRVGTAVLTERKWNINVIIYLKYGPDQRRVSAINHTPPSMLNSPPLAPVYESAHLRALQ